MVLSWIIHGVPYLYMTGWMRIIFLQEHFWFKCPGLGGQLAGKQEDYMAKLLPLWPDDALFKQSQYKTPIRSLVIAFIWTFERQQKLECSWKSKVEQK